MKSGLIFLVLTVILFSCKKDKLENGFEILQGKWRWVGSSEVKENKVTGSTTSTWISSSEFQDDYFFEFERIGKVSYWVNEKEEEFYRIETTNFEENCPFNLLENCRFIGLNLNFNIKKQLSIYMNEDTLKCGSQNTHLPLQNYNDNVASYSYLHTFVRIN